MPLIIKDIDRILKSRPDQKGLVHTISYNIWKNLKDYYNGNSRCLFPTATTKDAVLEQHNEGREPTVLFSPSLTEGFDGKYDIIRFQVFCKVPYADLGDTRIAIKSKRDKGWYDYQTMKTFIQAIGRGMRKEDDWCHNFILDNRMKDFLKRVDLGDEINLTIVPLKEILP
jgi:Rad3-related DNA helicase